MPYSVIRQHREAKEWTVISCAAKQKSIGMLLQRKRIGSQLEIIPYEGVVKGGQIDADSYEKNRSSQQKHFLFRCIHMKLKKRDCNQSRFQSFNSNQDYLALTVVLNIS